MNRRLLTVLASALLAIQMPIYGQTKILVGAYTFPPFYTDGSKSSIIDSMIKVFNESQKQFEFKIVPTTPTGRYQDFKQNKFDIMMFESIKWGWESLPVTPSRVFLKGGEVYVTKKQKGRGQSYFSHFKGKKLVGFRGYHYQFANFNSNPQYLKKNFNMELVTDHGDSLARILASEGDIAIITKSYLLQKIVQEPKIKNEILISENMDQEYNHTILVRKNGPISIADIHRLLDNNELKLKELWWKNGIELTQ